MDTTSPAVFQQHLIDPEICIRCNTCEATSPVDAITHDSNNYVVDATKCNFCMACVPPCPTGSIDNWRTMPRQRVYTLEEQFRWEELPAELSPEQLAELGIETIADHLPADTSLSPTTDTPTQPSANYNASIPPWSAAHPYTNLYGVKSPQPYVTATVAGNVRVTAVGRDYDTHHIVLDFGTHTFPVLEGQSIGIIPPGTDAKGKPHHARQYSIASPRDGERPGYNNVSLTIKRVLEDHAGKPVRGLASNYMCDLKVGDKVQVIGPFGSTFLMPNHPHSNLVMICTGTGSAPMRAMTEWRRRLHKSGQFAGGKLMLFFGARTPEELPYFGPLQKLPKDFIDINFAFSRLPDQPKRYVQDVMRERAGDLLPLLQDPNTYFYVCGLKNMEAGVLQALHDIVSAAGLVWDDIGTALKQQGRLHMETY